MNDPSATKAVDLFKACLAILLGYLCFNLSTYIIVSPLISGLFAQSGYSNNTVLFIDLLSNTLAYSLAAFLACVFARRFVTFTGIGIAVLTLATYNVMIALPEIRAGSYQLWCILAVNFTVAGGTVIAIHLSKKSIGEPDSRDQPLERP
ncbi:hypothetical protein [Microbulbifer halophilus]|uniref:Uncharacterized protein n=1 Tax=Microbulbifer halophilus TaxID=453963 RepID=A0ABW5EHL1_9GAMM|nr:hypothetical protein [Microbulbifer halophilus]MCW8127388.1 hypothetical protein [Microbulbifer halophilus]